MHWWPGLWVPAACVLLVCLLALSFLPLLVLAQEASVTAELSPNPVGVDEQVSLVITVSGSGSAQPPQIPKISGLKLVGGPSVSNQFQWINGQSSSSQSFTYVLLPETEGTVKVPPIAVRVAGKTYQTNEITLRVVKEATGQGQAPRRRSPFSVFDDMGLEEDSPLRDRTPRRAEVLTVAEVDKRSAFAGEQVTLTYKILTQLPIIQVEVKEIPSLNGFWVEEIEVPKNPTAANRVLNGKQYAEYVIKKQALFPTTSGTLQIPSATFALVVRTSSGGFFSLGTQESVFRKTEPIAVKVMPLPEAGRPPGFSGAVGNFKLESVIDRATAETGQALNLKVTLSGTGNLKTITEFPLPELLGFKIYSSKSNDQVAVRNDVLQGNKSWEYVIIPQAPGKERIPDLKFHYFSPASKQYREAGAPGLDVAVLKGKGGSVGEEAQTVILQQGIVKRGSDINYIKMSSRPLKDRSKRLYQSAWVWVGLLAPLLFNAGMLLYTSHQARLRQDVTGFRSRRAGRVAEKRLAEAQACLKGRQYNQFHSILESSICGYLSDKFNLPQIEITTQQIKRFMEERRLNSHLAEEVTALLEECNFARYAPVQPDGANLEALYAKAKRAIVRIESEVR
ncbi:MAG: BatD family protein [Acidobacteria bacterium]|nr:BatD family protein [Acidobacteriota bacterium]MCI0719913.1 BatD family protein [Acidobacteriota bacterium]